MKFIEAAIQSILDADQFKGLQVKSVVEDNVDNTDGETFAVTIKAEWRNWCVARSRRG